MIDTSTLPSWVEDVDERPSWDRSDAWLQSIAFDTNYYAWEYGLPVPAKRSKHRYGR